MKLKKLFSKPLSVKVVHDPLDVGVRAKPFLVTIFENKEVAPRSNAMGPLGGLDLTGYSEYRLTLHFAGEEGSLFSIEEVFGPAGSIDQMRFEIGGGEIGPRGILNYRGAFQIFGPRHLFIQIANHGNAPFQVNGTLYVVR